MCWIDRYFCPVPLPDGRFHVRFHAIFCPDFEWQAGKKPTDVAPKMDDIRNPEVAQCTRSELKGKRIPHNENWRFGSWPQEPGTENISRYNSITECRLCATIGEELDGKAREDWRTRASYERSFHFFWPLERIKTPLFMQHCEIDIIDKAIEEATAYRVKNPSTWRKLLGSPLSKDEVALYQLCSGEQTALAEQMKEDKRKESRGEGKKGGVEQKSSPFSSFLGRFKPKK